MGRARSWLGGVAAAMVAASIFATPVSAEIIVRWTRPIGATLAGVATDRAGRTAVTGSTRSGPDGRVVVRSFTAAGVAEWSSTWRPVADSWAYGSALDIGPAGRVFVAGAVWTPLDMDAPTTWFLRVYSRHGMPLWTRLAPGWREESTSSYAGDVGAWSGGVVLAASVCGEGGCYGGSVRSYAPSGRLRWIKRVGGIHGTAEALTITPAGTVYVTGAFNDSQGPIGEGDHLYVTKLGRDGMKEWTHRFAGDEGSGTTIDVRRGAVVAAGVSTEGGRTWLLSLRGNGTERWTRTWRRRSIADLDIARSGRIWATGTTHPGGHAALYVRIVRPDGTWTRTWRRDPADVAVWGTGVSWDPFGVSVVGQVGSSGRLWRLQG